MKKILFTLLSFACLYGGEIKIAVAANVSYAMDELIKTFNQTNPNTKVQVILSSSGNLFAQIRNNAPFGLFMSANMKYPDKLYKLGLAHTKPIIYARGSLALFTKKNLDLKKGIDLLASKDIKSIAIANPDVAPYGKASLEALKNAKLEKNTKTKLIYAQTISQTLVYSLNATDIGFVAKSALFSPKMTAYKKGKNWVNVNPKLYTPINQGIVILNTHKQDKEIKAFYDFILSKKAKDIFKKYGYLI